MIIIYNKNYDVYLLKMYYRLYHLNITSNNYKWIHYQTKLDRSIILI